MKHSMKPDFAEKRRDIVLVGEGADRFAGAWQLEGDAFRRTVAEVGKCGYVDSSDALFHHFSGTMSSPEFAIERRYLTLDFSCYAWDRDTGLILWVDGREEFHLSDSIAHTPGVRKYALDVNRFQGRRARIELRDAGVWEHVSVGNIVLTDACPEDAEVILPADERVRVDRSFVIGAGAYLLIPIDKRQNHENCFLAIDGKTILNLRIKLAKSREADFYASIPLKNWSGSSLRFFTEDAILSAPTADAFHAMLSIAPEPAGSNEMYREAGRPKLHFSPWHGGNGDMVGFFCGEGRYHICYLWDPVYDQWPMNCCWGHAVSHDLLHWEPCPVVNWKGNGVRTTSGSCFVDEWNRSGLGAGTVLLFGGQEIEPNQRFQDFSVMDTSPGNVRFLSALSLKYSRDGGRTFVPFTGNPLFYSRGVGGHDPEVFYYEAEDKFVMVLHDRSTKGGWGFDFYESKDLLDWHFLSSAEDYWETPLCYPLALDGDPRQRYWILQECSLRYTIGRFDGKRVEALTDKISSYRGGFAPRSFCDRQGRRILMAAAGIHFSEYSEGYCGDGGSTLPLELTLRSTPDGMRVYYQPVADLESLREMPQCRYMAGPDEINVLLRGLSGEIFDVYLRWNLRETPDFSLMSGAQTLLHFDRTARTWQIGAHSASWQEEQTDTELRLLIDDGMVSYFFDRGLCGGTVAFQHCRASDAGLHLRTGEGLKMEYFSAGTLRSPFRDVMLACENIGKV